MKMLKIDASHWKEWPDFYDTVLTALESPALHGRNQNALLESMVWGEVNAVEPPYILQICSTEELPDDIKRRLFEFIDRFEEARADFKLLKGHDVDARIQVIS